MKRILRLFGTSVVQLYVYFSRFPEDPLYLKVLVRPPLLTPWVLTGAQGGYVLGLRFNASPFYCSLIHQNQQNTGRSMLRKPHSWRT